MRVFQVNLTQHVRANNLSEVSKMFADLKDQEPALRNVELRIVELETTEETPTE